MEPNNRNKKPFRLLRSSFLFFGRVVCCSYCREGGNALSRTLFSGGLVVRPLTACGHSLSFTAMAPPELTVRFRLLTDLLRMFFDCLYDEEVISEDAFYKWESSKDPAEQNGKGVALKSVTAFFTWLREAEEESEDN